MRLAHCEFHFVIHLPEDRTSVLVVERAEYFRKYVDELCRQTENGSGSFVLSVDGKEIDLAKYAQLLIDVLHPEINGRKQQNALYHQLQSIAVNEKFFQATMAVKDILLSWLIHLEGEVMFPVVHADTVDTESLFKSLNVRIDDTSSSVLDRFIVYMKVCTCFLKTKLLICVGLHEWFSFEELEMIYQAAAYEKLRIMDIERSTAFEKLPREKLYIIDKDLCEIYNEDG